MGESGSNLGRMAWASVLFIFIQYAFFLVLRYLFACVKGWAWAYTYSVLPNFACEARPAQGLDIVVDRVLLQKLDIHILVQSVNGYVLYPGTPDRHK